MSLLRIKFRVLLVALPLVFCAPQLLAAPESVQGFVTDVHSPTDFQLGKLRVVVSSATACDTGLFSSSVWFRIKLVHKFFWQSYFVMGKDKVEEEPKAHYCGSLGLTVGMRVEATGELDPGQERMAATHITLHRQILNQGFGTSLDTGKWDSTALLEEAPRVTHTESGWKGKMWIAGYPTDLAPDANVQEGSAGLGPRFKETRLYTRLPKAEQGTKDAPAKASAELFRPNTWVKYGGFPEQENNRVSLVQINLWPNGIPDLERQFDSRFNVAVHQDDPSHSGTVVVSDGKHEKALKLLPDADVQRFVAKIGNSVVPEYQKLLPESDPTKVHFHFYVVSADRGTLEDVRKPLDGARGFRQDTWKFSAIGLPDGTVLVADWALASWKTDAQLATVLSYAITNVLQKDSYLGVHVTIQESYIVSDDNDGFNFEYILGRDEQQLRIALRQAYLAGYDVRELPGALGAVDGHDSAALFQEGAAQERPLWYAAYLFDYLSKYYETADFAGLKSDSASYTTFLARLRQADPAAFAKVH